MTGKMSREEESLGRIGATNRKRVLSSSKLEEKAKKVGRATQPTKAEKKRRRGTV